MSAANVGSILDLAMRLLASREHSRTELKRKLGARGYATLEIEPVLSDLAERGLQSDRRYAESYTTQRTERGFGPLRIRAELHERGVNSDIIATTLNERDGRWTERLRSVAQSRFGPRNKLDQRDLARRARFLERRGYAADAIRQYLFD